MSCPERVKSCYFYRPLMFATCRGPVALYTISVADSEFALHCYRRYYWRLAMNESSENNPHFSHGLFFHA